MLSQTATRKQGFKGKILPSGRFSFGWDCASCSRERSTSQSYESDLEQQNSVSVESREAALLNLTILSISRKRKGQKGISGLGKGFVTSGASLLERKYGRRRLGFQTITIPPMAECDRKILHRYWNEFTHRFFEEYRRQLTRAGSPSDTIVSVTEIQERRLKRYGNINLHLHFICLSNDGAGHFYIHPVWLRELMRRIITNLINRHSTEVLGDHEFKPNTHRWTNCCKMQVIKKSAIGYISKYLSKGGKTMKALNEEQREDLPCQWWYVSGSLKRIITKYTVTFDIVEAQAFLDNLPRYDTQGYLIWCHIGELPVGKEKALTYFIGQVNYKLSDELVNFCKEELKNLPF